ncbi:hypothetical protein B0H17DRAFT_1146008 [Mycena rosella]|uniref:Uncharacterized protein n=1 Tax=Mycena rosella TaxID=1033263 RepID=A0AAD7CPU9_MYCRO|nr:hypothetical protein B0H17DRAFT_1146008 [Mycena rosella]
MSGSPSILNPTLTLHRTTTRVSASTVTAHHRRDSTGSQGVRVRARIRPIATMHRDESGRGRGVGLHSIRADGPAGHNHAPYVPPRALPRGRPASSACIRARGGAFYDAPCPRSATLFARVWGRVGVVYGVEMLQFTAFMVWAFRVQRRILSSAGTGRTRSSLFRLRYLRMPSHLWFSVT